MLTLRPMTEEEYERFADPMWEDYAHERARNFGTSLDEERAEAARQRATFLPDGMRTPGHHFWHVVDDTAGVVGSLWVHVDAEKHRAFIYNIEVDAAQRGKGYGRRTLEALEEQLRPLGVTRIALNVFGDNAVAMRLYQRMGYLTIATEMRKEI